MTWSTPIGIDDAIVTLRFEGDISFHKETIAVSGIEVSIVSEPASLAVFGLGLAGLGYPRRRRSV